MSEYFENPLSKHVKKVVVAMGDTDAWKDHLPTYCTNCAQATLTETVIDADELNIDSTIVKRVAVYKVKCAISDKKPKIYDKMTGLCYSGTRPDKPCGRCSQCIFGSEITVIIRKNGPQNRKKCGKVRYYRTLIRCRNKNRIEQFNKEHDEVYMSSYLTCEHFKGK